MCISSPRTARPDDDACGVGQHLDDMEIDSLLDDIEIGDADLVSHSPSEITEDVLKKANQELHILQQRMLQAPKRSDERKALSTAWYELDAQIKHMQDSFAHTNEVQRVATSLSDSIESGDGDAIASSLQRLVKMASGLTSIDDVSLYYLVGCAQGVVAAVKQHTANLDVVKGGCHALCELFAVLSTQLDYIDDVTQTLCSAEVGEVVLAGMGCHLADRQVQLYGCRVLNILAVRLSRTQESIEARVAIACMLTSARVTVGQARRHHSGDEEVAQWADSAMRLL